MFKQLIQDEKIVSVTGTIFIHLILLSLFFLIHINFRPVMEEFTELTLSGGFQAPVSEQPSPLDTPEMSEPETPQEEASQSLPEQIELPERRQLELNEQEILDKVQPSPEKQFNPGQFTKKNRAPALPSSGKTTSTPSFTRQEKGVEKGLFNKQLDEKLLNGAQKVPISTERPFKIDWSGDIEREIYQKTMPQFPPDVQREATIKIRFTVLPNGLVGSAVLMQKGDTKLENATLEAFKSWRFNPLPAYVKQVSQTGVITFHFELK